jgi:hypothetical protein
MFDFDAQVAAFRDILDARTLAQAKQIARRFVAAVDDEPISRVAKPRAMSTEAFFDAWCEAKTAAPYNWHLHVGCSVLAELTGGRTFKTARGTTIRLPAQARIPAAQYWPGGRLPERLKVYEPAPVADVDARWEATWAAERDMWAMVRDQEARAKQTAAPVRTPWYATASHEEFTSYIGRGFTARQWNKVATWFPLPIGGIAIRPFAWAAA